MLGINPQIILGDKVFSFVTDVTIESSWELFTDTAVILLPNKFEQDGETITAGVDNLFKRGDKVEIRLGYKPNKDLRFTGFISKILPDSPLRIECEDAMWLLKQETITKSFKSVSLDDLLKAIIPSTVPFKTNITDSQLGQFRITRASIAQVLEELKKTYGLVSFVRDGTLQVGLAYPFIPATVHEIRFQEDIISSDLEFRREEDVKIKVKGISILPNNTKIEIEEGDPDGEQRTLTYFNLSETELKRIVKDELPKFKFTGYEGTFEMFGEPFIQHGDNVKLIDKKFPERDGTYVVDSVNTTESVTGGLRQSVGLGAIAA